MQNKYFIQKEQFVDDTDLYTSFLFSLLGASYTIKLDLDDMIQYDELNDVQSFWQTLGGIIRQLLQFESTAKSLDAANDSESPYVQDDNGNVFLKKQLQSQGELSESDLDEDDYDYEYVIEEETEYEHIMAPILPYKSPTNFKPVLKSQEEN